MANTNIALPNTAFTEPPELWVLHYRQGYNPHPMQKNFRCKGTLKSIIERCKAHCEVMGIRFVNVRPFISDLEADERKRTESEVGE